MSLADARAAVDALELPEGATPLLRPLLVVQRALQQHASPTTTLDALLLHVRNVGRTLEDHLGDDVQALRASWGEHDLPSLLDALAAQLSKSAKRAFDEPAQKLLEEDVADCLYGEIAPAISLVGWFDLDVVRPFQTRFDPRVHKALEVMKGSSHPGIVVELVRPGRKHRGALLEASHVVVGG